MLDEAGFGGVDVDDGDAEVGEAGLEGGVFEGREGGGWAFLWGRGRVSRVLGGN